MTQTNASHVPSAWTRRSAYSSGTCWSPPSSSARALRRRAKSAPPAKAQVALGELASRAHASDDGFTMENAAMMFALAAKSRCARLGTKVV